MPKLLHELRSANPLARYRQNIIGSRQMLSTPYGRKRMLYADWTGSGRLYRPIERYLSETLGAFVGNPHTESSLTGSVTTSAYQQAKVVIKRHFNAAADDALLFVGCNMTSAVHKLQRLLGLRLPERFSSRIHLAERERPLVLISHMEHHSNQITWNACAADVVVVRPAEDGLPDLNHLEHVLHRHRRRALKIGSFTACSNVTGLLPPIHTLAEIMHRHGGYCFVDATAAAPYLRLDLHPGQNEQRLDALFFAAHKFLGGPGSAGVLLFARELYYLRVPDQGGGGTVAWTNPWGEQGYYDDIEMREDGGTPGFIPAIKAALAVLLKEKMGLKIIRSREEYLKDLLLDRLAALPGLRILAAQHKDRLGIVSWHAPRRHHNLLARLLCDRFGIQVRGGCSCAGTYGHYLLGIGRKRSQAITDQIDHGDWSSKPGWVRISLHPVMNVAEVEFIAAAVAETLENFPRWQDDYRFEPGNGEFYHRRFIDPRLELSDSLRTKATQQN